LCIRIHFAQIEFEVAQDYYIRTNDLAKKLKRPTNTLGSRCAPSVVVVVVVVSGVVV
jgi:hypothetical protein